MAKITANNIFIGSITSDKLDSSVASGLAVATNANTIATIASTVAAAAFSSANTISAILANTSTPIITSITIADSSYNALDDTAANTTGGFCIITGSGFTSAPTVIFGTTAAPAVTYMSATTLRVQIPALTAASYPVYVVNSNGGTAIRVNGLTTSSFPAWGTNATLSNTNTGIIFSVLLSANSDSSITYANTTALPEGSTLAANGLFSGTITVESPTTYTFDVKATDAENQDASRTFSLTVTVNPPAGLYVTGQGAFGNNGLNGLTVSSPVLIGASATWLNVSSGYATGAIKENGTLWTWGYNVPGLLGNGNRNNTSSPAQVGSDTNWSSQIDARSQSMFAIKTDGTLWSWGQNGSGRLGTNSAILRSTVGQVGTNTNWSKISCGGGAALAIKTDGTLWSWGVNQYGQLGSNNRIYRSSPVQVGAGTTWSNVSAAESHVMATKTDGTLWAWGRNLEGQLGLGNTVSRSSPVQVGSGFGTFVSCGAYQSAALGSTGFLYMCGLNTAGQLGLNDRTARSTIALVSTSDWSKISLSQWNAVAAIKTDGSLWVWGNLNAGDSGLSDTIERSSPSQVGARTNWVNVTKGYFNTIGLMS
jgi:alpha-tubulin suppressor-like RCC1 family protein